MVACLPVGRWPKEDSAWKLEEAWCKRGLNIDVNPMNHCTETRTIKGTYTGQMQAYGTEGVLATAEAILAERRKAKRKEKRRVLHVALSRPPHTQPNKGG